MPAYYSKRARILAEVLEYINSDDWDHCEDFLVFGKEAFEVWCESPRHSGEGATERELRKLVNKVKVNRGARDVARKVSIENLPPDSTSTDVLEFLKTLPREDLRRLNEELGRTAKSTMPPKTETQLTFDPDAVEAALAAEFVQLLDKTVYRIGNYGDLKLRQTHPGVARYFDEAHRCFLFGMDIACAVLCRALLEAALIVRIDPQHKLKPTIGQQGGHISRMIAAANGRLLKGNRAAAAERIKEAGNWAIHEYERFQKKYSHRMGEIVEDMRKILLDLYGCS
jgi:uncharacterized protein DUF4145